MPLLAAQSGRHEFRRQADKCRSMGSSFVASILEAVERQLSHAPISDRMIADWPGDPAAAAVAMRVNGALHALARRGAPSDLAALYRGEHQDFDGAVRSALSQHDQFIADWLRHPTQTNEIARAGAVMCALMTVSWRWPMPIDLLEMGSSCGLNLNLARYAYGLGGVEAGDSRSELRIEPVWRGAPPPVAPVDIASARGVDLNPLDASNPAHRERLLAFAWADQPERSNRLEKALRIAEINPPMIEKANALPWLVKALSEPQPEGRCRAVVHTMFLQYLHDVDRRDIALAMAAAGARATQARPLAWISFEWTADRSVVELRLTTWPQGESVVLARCHPYGDWLEWCATPEDDPAQARPSA